MPGFHRETRYDVHDDFPIVAYSPSTAGVVYRLKTLSLRGCGIYVDFQDVKRLQQQTVTLHFRWGDRKLKMVGQVKYCVHTLKGENFLGIKFLYPNKKFEAFLKYIVDKGLSDRLLQAKKIGFMPMKKKKKKRYHRVIKIV
jgi:hypothetical protein